MKKELSWKFPKRNFFLLRIEKFSIIAFSLLILFIATLASGKISTAILSCLSFILIYIIISYTLSILKNIGELYKITSTHIHIKSKSTNREKKFLLKELKGYKADKIFLGGYVIDKMNNKHALYFNNRKELEKFETEIQQHIKK